MKLFDLLDDIACDIRSWKPGTRLDAKIESHVFAPNTVGFFAAQYPLLRPLVDRPQTFLKRLTDLLADDLFNDPSDIENASVRLRRFAHEANAAQDAAREASARLWTFEQKAHQRSRGSAHGAMATNTGKKTRKQAGGEASLSPAAKRVWDAVKSLGKDASNADIAKHLQLSGGSVMKPSNVALRRRDIRKAGLDA